MKTKDTKEWNLLYALGLGFSWIIVWLFLLLPQDLNQQKIEKLEHERIMLIEMNKILIKTVVSQNKMIKMMKKGIPVSFTGFARDESKGFVTINQTKLVAGNGVRSSSTAGKSNGTEPYFNSNGGVMR